MTDFENAALIVVLGMIYNTLNHFDVNFMMAISLIDENMERAHERDAIYKRKFWFRTNILPTGKCYKYNTLEESDYTRSNDFANGSDQVNCHGCCFDDNETYEELYLFEILDGKPESKYKGVFPLIREYMQKMEYPKEDVEKVNLYMSFVLARA